MVTNGVFSPHNRTQYWWINGLTYGQGGEQTACACVSLLNVRRSMAQLYHQVHED